MKLCHVLSVLFLSVPLTCFAIGNVSLFVMDQTASINQGISIKFNKINPIPKNTTRKWFIYCLYKVSGRTPVSVQPEIIGGNTDITSELSGWNVPTSDHGNILQLPLGVHVLSFVYNQEGFHAPWDLSLFNVSTNLDSVLLVYSNCVAYVSFDKK